MAVADAVAQHGIVCLSTIDWDFLWQRQQELMSRFARAGIPVLYVEPLGVRTAGLADAARIVRRLRRWMGQRSHSSAEVRPGLRRLSPFAVPVQGRRSIDRLNTWLVARRLRQTCRAMGMAAPILWTYYATHAVLGLADALRPAAIVYDCIDDVARNARGVAADYAATERELLQRADLVLATSSLLSEDKQRVRADVHLAPPGCNAEHFIAPAAEAADIAALPHPRLCFFGGIDERLDIGLLAGLARRRPDWTLVLLGVVRTDVSPLRDLPNVVFISQRPYSVLPAYLQHMDALLLPYVITEYTRRIYPAKVFECLATGKPVVAAALPDLLPLRDLVQIVEPGDDVARAIDDALHTHTPAAARRRQEMARANSWEARVAQIDRLLRRALAQREKTP